MNSETPKRMTKVPETIEKMADDWEVTLSFPSDLPKKLKDNLGYKPLSVAYEKWINNIVTEIDLQVLKLLEKLNIMPFNPKDIREYQQHLVEPLNQEYAQLIAKKNRISSIFFAIIIIMLIACISGFIWNIPPLKYCGWFSFISIFICAWHHQDSKDSAPCYWATIGLKEYYEKIPVSVLTHIININENLKESKFTIEKMKAHGLNMKKNRLLVMVYREKKYYIDIWDESEFNGKTID